MPLRQSIIEVTARKKRIGYVFTNFTWHLLLKAEKMFVLLFCPKSEKKLPVTTSSLLNG